MIHDSIPSILEEISKKQADAQRAMTESPITTAYERRAFFASALSKATKALEAQQAGRWMEGDSGKTALAKQHEAFEKFGKQVWSTRLANISRIDMGSDVLVSTKSGKEIKGRVVAMTKDRKTLHVLPSENELEDEPHDLLLPTQEDDSPSPDPCTKGKLFNCNSENCVFCSIGCKGGSCSLCVTEHTHYLGQMIRKFSEIKVEDAKKSLDWLEVLIKDRRNDDLPCFLSAQLFSSIVANMVQCDWASLCSSLVTDSIRTLEARIQETFSAYSSKRFPKVGGYFSQTITEVVNESGDAAQRKVEELLAMDTRPYTQNHYLFENINKRRNESLKKNVLAVLNSMVTPTTQQNEKVVDGSALLSAVAGVFTANEKKSMTQHVAEEMETVLEVYGKVAAKRIIDQVPMLVQKITRDALRSIEKRFANVTDEELLTLIRDRPEFIRQHQRAAEKLKTMEKALAAVKRMRPF
jgi:hypothetical protein